MNHQLFTQKNGYLLVAILFFTFLFSCRNQNEQPLTYSAQLQEVYKQNLQLCISYADSLSHTHQLSKGIEYYFFARKYFKICEPIMAYVDAESYSTLNQPNLIQVSEEDLTDIKINSPQGFQVLEENIFGDNPDLELMRRQAHFLMSRLSIMHHNVRLSDYKDYHFLWMLRDQILRTSMLGITGYDSPVNQYSLLEAQHTYEGVSSYLAIYKPKFSNEALYNSWKKSIELSIQGFKGVDFDNFDRYSFIKERVHQQLDLWNATVQDWKVNFPIELAIQNTANNLFSEQTFNMQYFAGHHAPSADSNYIQLGKMLFYEESLSRNQELSCATCHDPSKAFTDGRKLAIGHDGATELKRNSPTLTYAAFQKGFFYDKRVGNLEGQIAQVFDNPLEFNYKEELAFSRIKKKDHISEYLITRFDSDIQQGVIKEAIAAYVRSLSPFKSKFDKNMRGEESNLNEQEIKGFNLFMGKAGCGTCHFTPLFNGTLPTRFKDSELEALGVPKDENNQAIDDDLGRYDIFKTAERKHFFKTPTLRNIALTAPYMHNGVYSSLEQVMDFYNKGGGQGLGLSIEHQTLPSEPLNLSENEIEAIISFMKTLTDEPSDQNYSENQSTYLSMQ